MFPFFNHYPGTDLHEIDLAYILKLCAELQASNTDLTEWKTEQQAELDAIRALFAQIIAGDVVEIDVVTGWQYKKVIAIGDSFAEGYTPEDGSVPANGWSNKLRTVLGVPSTNYINKYLGGTGFSTEGSNGGFLGLLNSAATDNPDFTADAIIVAGGRNDQGAAEATIETGIATFVNRAKQLYPNCTVYIGMLSWDGDPTIQSRLTKVLRAYQHASLDNGAIYLSGIEFILHNYLYLSAADVKHPNSLGNSKIAQQMGAILKGGGSDIIYTRNANIVPVTGFTFNNTQFITQVHNEITNYRAGRINIEIANSTLTVTCDGTRVKIADAGDLVNKTAADIGIQLPMTITLRDGNNDYYAVGGYLVILGGEVFISCRAIADDKRSFLTLSNVNRIQIERFESSFPSMP